MKEANGHPEVIFFGCGEAEKKLINLPLWYWVQLEEAHDHLERIELSRKEDQEKRGREDELEVAIKS